MPTRHQIDETLKEIGKHIEAVAITYFEEFSRWIMEFEDEEPITLAPLQRAGHLLLSSPIGRFDDAFTSEIFDLVMLYNGQGTQTGGFTIGLDEPAGGLKLSLVLGHPDFESTQLGASIMQFRVCRRTWKAVVENWSAEGLPAATEGGFFDSHRHV